VTRAVIIAAVICAAGAALEGFAAGSGVRRRLSRLRQPPYSPPFAIWIAIGGLYYVVCFVVAFRLLHTVAPAARLLPLALLLVLMAANAAWNYAFFRREALGAAAVMSVPYGFVALALLFLLSRIDRVAFWWLLPYVAYLPYGAWWQFALRRANAERYRTT
jgi:tryptophan-rich sensory protein